LTWTSLPSMVITPPEVSTEVTEFNAGAACKIN
jgi:hypothetical protein